jgi:hypothetical protein
MKKIGSWLSNVWYHSRYVILIGAFFAIVLIIGIIQICQNEDYDVQFVYAGPASLDETSGNEICVALSSVSGDADGDGKKNLFLHRYTVLSDEQLAQKKAEAEAEGDSIYYDYSLRTDAISSIGTLLATGEVSICFLDSYVYSIYSAQDAFLPLEEALGYLPDYAVDSYAVYLKDTDFGKYFTVFDLFPDDTLLCIRREPLLSGFQSQKKVDAAYQNSLETFQCIFSFHLSD